MSDAVVLPPQILALRDACSRLLEKFEDESDPAAESSGSADDGEPFDLILSGVLATHLTNLEEGMGRLWGTIEELEEAMETGEYDSSMVYSIMGRFEAYVEIFRSDSIKVRAWRVSGEDLIARDLLVSIHRHFLNEIRDWLADALVALGNPVGALENLGVDVPDGMAVEIVTAPGVAVTEIPISLEFTIPREVADLNSWTKRRADQIRREEKLERRRAKRHMREQVRSERDHSKVSKFVLGALFGGWLSNWNNDE